MKIALLGDSIRGQYQPRVTQLLGEGFEVFGPKENCRFAKYTLRGLFDWRAELKDCRIVHWNNGLWDICNLFGDGCFTGKDEYLSNMLRIAELLTARHDKVIFATTTPVTERNFYNKNSDIIEYNSLLVPELVKLGIEINDLHAPVYKDVERYICDDNVHLSAEGIELCAGLTANAVRNAAIGMTDIKKSADAPQGSGAPVVV